MRSRRCRPLLLTIPLALSMAFGAPAAAQDTRAEQHEQQQAAKAEVTKPPTKNFFERLVDRSKRIGWFDREVAGFHPIASTIYPGGWLAFGAGYRKPFHDDAAFTLDTVWSLKNFKETTARLQLPAMASGHLLVDLTSTWMDAPTVAFYGVGNASRDEDRVTFGYRPTTTGISVRALPTKFVSVGGGADYMHVATLRRMEGTLEAVTPFATAPGMGLDASFVVTRAFAQIDWRTAPGYSGTGGLYRVDVRDYAARDGDITGFRNLQLELVQLVPIIRANWVLAFRGLATLTDSPNDRPIPFYLMPTIGGNSAVRGYSSFRFIDNNRLVMNGELRWTPAKVMDAALFYDVGKVAPKVRDLGLNDLKSSYGVGVRFHTIRRTVLRLELARTGEGAMRFVFSTNAAF